MALSSAGWWLNAAKAEVTNSADWTRFTQDLCDAVEQQLLENHVQYFTDLSDAEKNLFLEKSVRAIQNRDSFRSFYFSLSKSLDQHLSSDVGKRMLHPDNVTTKTDLLLQESLECVAYLLRKMPEMKSKLHVFLNQPIPDKMRPLTWRLFLHQFKARQEYLDRINRDPKSTLSIDHQEIADAATDLLNKQGHFPDLGGTDGAIYTMEAVLSYFHLTLQTSTPLANEYYLYILPILQVAIGKLPKNQRPITNTVVDILEEFIALVASRPSFVASPDKRHEGFRDFVERVCAHLLAVDQSVTSAISLAFTPSKEKVVATEQMYEFLREGIATLSEPLLQSLFVGYVDGELNLFLWDQIIIGLDVPGYWNEILPVLVATLLLLLKEPICKASSVKAVSTAVKTGCIHLKPRQFQILIQKHFYKKLDAILHSDEPPILDPTKDARYTWRHWHEDFIPRSAENDSAGKGKLHKATQCDPFDQADDSRTNDLERQLARKQRDKDDSEQRALAAIDALRKELDYYRRDKTARSPAPSLLTVDSAFTRYLIPQPTASARQFPLPTPAVRPTPTPEPDSQTRVRNALADMVAKVTQTILKVAHGEGPEKIKLDYLTRQYLHQHIQDLKAAEAAVFGENFDTLSEFERMSEGRMKDKSEELMEFIKERVEDRYAQKMQKPKTDSIW